MTFIGWCASTDALYVNECEECKVNRPPYKCGHSRWYEASQTIYKGLFHILVFTHNPKLLKMSISSSGICVQIANGENRLLSNDPNNDKLLLPSDRNCKFDNIGVWLDGPARIAQINAWRKETGCGKLGAVKLHFYFTDISKITWVIIPISMTIMTVITWCSQSEKNFCAIDCQVHTKLMNHTCRLVSLNHCSYDVFMKHKSFEYKKVRHCFYGVLVLWAGWL